MERILTIALPITAKRLAAVLVGVAQGLDEELYVTARSNGLAVYSDSHRNLSSWEKQRLK